MAGGAPARGGGTAEVASLTELLLCAQGDTEAREGTKTCPRSQGSLANSNSKARLCLHLWVQVGTEQGQANTYRHHQTVFSICACGGWDIPAQMGTLPGMGNA